MSGLERLNALPAEAARAELLHCCGSPEWARRMEARRPFAGEEALFEAAETIWWTLDETEWHAAFRSHPRIGESRAAAAQSERERRWSAGEQAGMAAAAEETRRAMAEGNHAYEARFGHIYLVCAAGRSAEELLGLLRRRLGNDPREEIRVAAREQAKITRLRLRKLLDTDPPSPPQGS